MLEKITSISINATDYVNQTDFNIIQSINKEPYQMTGFLILFGLLLLFWFIGGFSKVSRSTKSSKICFQSWIHWRFLFIILLGALVTYFWFYYPIIKLVSETAAIIGFVVFLIIASLIMILISR